MKVAIYVEGITEAGFVYQLIGEKYQWDWTKVHIDCLNLDPKDAADDLRDFGAEEAPDYFLIYDSGSDTSVVSDIRAKFQGHMDQGFDKVVGLRDVYSESYIDLYGRHLDSLDANGLISKAGVDVNSDPQTTYFHPYAKLEDIFKSIGKSYSKHWREIKEIIFKLNWTDFETLYNSGKCQSFREFYDSVFL